jgi:apolipoprotein D and lipocalin family protein
MKNIRKISLSLGLGIAAVLLLNSCSIGLPNGAKAVTNFQADKYLGKWYEIARFDFRFEKNLNQVTATYSKNEKGNIKVENRGYDYVKNEWKESIGEAKFVKNPNIAELKVSFFKPIWGSYNVIDIDENYKYALVVGKNKDYMWILSREKTIPENYKQRFLDKAKSLGFEIENLVWVKQK